jgi:leader peptidase (prepilin peptidase) / N-methyltransferase
MRILVESTSAVLGLCVGSFLNVVIWRLPRGESLSRPASHCPGCNAPLRPIDNVPLLSWLMLRGRCRSCGMPIAVRYPAVELLTALLWFAAAVRLGPHWELADYCVFFAALVALSAIDIDRHLLPSRIIYPTAGATVVLLGLASGLEARGRPALDGLAGATLAFSLLLLIHLIQPSGMGFGDVRLAGLIGLNVGWLGLARVGVALLGGFVLGSVVGLGLMVLGRAGRKSRIPFGPFLAGGGVIAVLWGGPLVHAWLGSG